MESIGSAADQKLDFMTLLVTEMQNQNPLEPMDQQQMAAQLAQFSQLETTEEMNGNISAMNETMKQLNSSFSGAMVMAEYDYAKTMLNKEVSFYNDHWGQSLTGKVERVDFDEGTPVLAVHVLLENNNGDKEMREFPVKLAEIGSVAVATPGSSEATTTNEPENL